MEEETKIVKGLEKWVVKSNDLRNFFDVITFLCYSYCSKIRVKTKDFLKELYGGYHIMVKPNLHMNAP